MLRKWFNSTSRAHLRRLAILGLWSLKMRSGQLLYPGNTSVLLRVVVPTIIEKGANIEDVLGNWGQC